MDADMELVSEFTCFIIEMIINYYLFTSKANGSKWTFETLPSQKKTL